MIRKFAAAGFTLIELLVALAIISLLIASTTVAYNAVRQKARDATRGNHVSTIRRALDLYLNDSPTGYPASAGECLRSGAGAGLALINSGSLILAVPVDPFWPTTAPAHTNGVPNPGQKDFCYFYYSDAVDKYKISYYLESDTTTGNAGIHTVSN
jgi:prepilin-type N-terminal cleavage/methylation domain-containing protein